MESRRRRLLAHTRRKRCGCLSGFSVLTINSETLAVAIAGPRHRMEGNVTEHARVLLATCSFIARQFLRA